MLFEQIFYIERPGLNSNSHQQGTQQPKAARTPNPMLLEMHRVLKCYPILVYSF